jgi:hypothetical protein
VNLFAKKQVREAGVAVFATIVFLVLAGRLIGIDPFDESLYLQGARWFHIDQIVGNQAWAPLYNFWYRGLEFVVSDPVKRYFVSWTLLVSFLALFPHVMRIRGAWIYTLLLLSLPVLLPVPYVSQFAAVWLLIGMCIAIRMQDRLPPFWLMFALASVTCFIAAFARPEYQDGVEFSALAAAIALFFERKSVKNKPRAMLAVFGSLVLAVTIHHIALHAAGDRSGFAFVDSVNMRASEKGLLGDESPWTSTYAQSQFHLDVGHRAPLVKAPIGQYFFANPKLFLSHVFDNVFDIRDLSAIFVITALMLWTWLRPENRTKRPVSAYFVSVCVAPIAGILLIYPREHYLVSMTPSLLLFAVYLIEPQRWFAPTVARVAAFAAVFLLFVSLTYVRLQHEPFGSQRRHVIELRCVQQADFAAAPSHTLVFDTAHGMAPYMHQFRYPVYPEELNGWEGFKTWAVTNHPAWIAMHPQTERLYKITPAQMVEFAQQIGYKAQPCATDPTFLIFTNPEP